MTATATAERRTDLEEAWITILAEYWRAVDWEQFQAQKARAETFDERAEVAARGSGVHDALDRLAKGLNMASPELPTRDLDRLVDENREAMRVLATERIYLVNKANETVRNYFEALDGGDDPEPTTSELTDFITTEDDQ